MEAQELTSNVATVVQKLQPAKNGVNGYPGQWDACLTDMSWSFCAYRRCDHWPARTVPPGQLTKISALTSSRAAIVQMEAPRIMRLEYEQPRRYTATRGHCNCDQRCEYVENMEF